MTELKNFMYELHRYADQTHTLKDAYEKLPEAEKTEGYENSTCICSLA